MKSLQYIMVKKWFVGTSGFMVRQDLWLSLPGLNCIEINSTFYALPSVKTILRWKALSPDLFFSLKVSKYITHIKRLKNCKGAWKQFWNRAKHMGDQLAAVLIQLPPSFRCNAETLGRVRAMASYLPRGGPTVVFEFRDHSWFVPEVFRLMKRHGWCLGGTAIERPTKAYWLGNLPTGMHVPPRTSDATYIRIHGQRGYKGYYDLKKLRQLKQKVERNKTTKNFIMFNNTFFSKRHRTCKARRIVRAKAAATKRAATKRATTKRVKIRYAAVCDAVEFARLTRRRRR